MDLSRKLARLESARPGAKPPLALEGQAERVERARALLEALVKKQRASGPRMVEAYSKGQPAIAPPPRLPGQRIETRHGEVHVNAFALPPDHCHGRIGIARSLCAPPDLIARLARDPALSDLDLGRMLLIDIETTGLSGGTGTIPFLIGLGWFEDQSLRIEQLFLARPGEERPMLELLRERILRASVLVTYNGKSFDVPLLLTRFVLYRVDPPLLPPHLDLLHCARRIYRRRLKELRLVRLEEEVLGMRRERDIEGYEIPALYWSFVRGQLGSAIDRVLEHNANDLVALAAVLAEAIDQLASVRPSDDPRDHLSIAEIAFRAGEANRALEFATAAARGGGTADLTLDAFELIARAHLRLRDPIAAEAALLDALRLLDGPPHLLRAAGIHLKLAKLLEHKHRAFERALVHAKKCALAEGEAANAKRIARLEARLCRSAYVA